MKQFRRIVRRSFIGRLRKRDPGPLTLNEAVNFEKQCIFIAIPKTGTTSIRSQLGMQGTPLLDNAHLNIVQVRKSLYVYYLKKALGNNYDFPTESILTDEEIQARADEVFKTFFKFSAVRNPWARAVSLYYRREGVQVSKEISFEDFCEKHFYASDTCRQPTLHRNQIDWLCDENGQFAMDYVYKVENFNEAIDEIRERTGGLVNLSRKKANENPKSPSDKYRDLYTEKTKRIIAVRFEKDIDFFKYSF